MIEFLIALGIFYWMLIMEDIQDGNTHHGFLKDWWYGENRWRAKYTDDTYTKRKWWSLVGLGAFIDVWHLVKTLRLIPIMMLLIHFAGLSLWWTPVAWGLYGWLHDRVFYGYLFHPAKFPKK